MFGTVRPGSQAEQVGRLILAGMLVIFLPSLPLGSYLIYPFVILTTWFHEMGHGLTALLVGEHFEQLMIYSSGSGVAAISHGEDTSLAASALIAAGGPLAPTFAGAGLIMASAHRKLWRPVLWGVAGAILLSMAIYVRSQTGLIVLPIVAVFVALVAWKASDGLARFTLQFLGIIAAMSMLADFDYLFTERIVLGGEAMLSDTGQIEASLFLPHWVWAIVLLSIAAVTTGASLKYALDEKRLLNDWRTPPRNVLQFKRK